MFVPQLEHTLIYQEVSVSLAQALVAPILRIARLSILLAVTTCSLVFPRAQGGKVFLITFGICFKVFLASKIRVFNHVS